MIWDKKKDPQIGDKRTRTFFTFTPKLINEKYYWLELLRIEEEFIQIDDLLTPYWYPVKIYVEDKSEFSAKVLTFLIATYVIVLALVVSYALIIS